MKIHHALLATCSVGVIGVAQTSRAEVAPPAAQPQASSQTATSTGNQVGEVVVTAQRRSENIQRTPLSIAVVDSTALTRRGVTQAQDLDGIVAGFQLGLAANTAQPYVRGVGNADNTGFAVSGIAFNVDGVYVAQPVSYGSSIFDVQRLEVLRGPQGTLYGRNASGGAVNIITNKPTYTDGGYVGAEYGNYDQVRVNGAYNIVVVPDKVAIRAAFQYGDRNGYFHDGTGDEDTLQGRIRVRLDPTTNLSILLNFEGSRENGNGPGYALDMGTSYNLPFPWDGPQGAKSLPYENAENVTQPPSQREKSYNTSAEIDYKFGDFTLVLLPAYRDVNIGLVNYNGFRYDVNANTYKEATAETRLQYDGSRLKAVGGIYYFHQDQSLNFFVDNTPLEIMAIIPKLTTESYAAFTQETYSLTNRLRLTGGLRYSHESQNLGQSENDFFSPAVFTIPYQGAASSKSLDYRAAVEYDVTPASLAYASIATGYKAGGVFPSPTGPYGGNTYKPERLYAYTLGLKNRFFGSALQLNGEGFYWRYKDKQETFTSTDGLGITDNVTKNAPLAVIYGADVDAVWRATPLDTFHATVEYLHAQYKEFTYDSFSTETGCPTTPDGAQFSIDCNGKQMARSPTYSGNAGYDHLFPLGSIGSLDLSGQADFSAARYLAVYYTAPVRAPSYVKGDVFLTYLPQNKRYSVTAYARNIGDTVIATGAYSSLRPNIYWVPLQPPRTYGVQLRVDF